MTQRLSPVPEVFLAVNGVPVVADSMRLLQSVRVAQRLSSPSQCELTFGIGPDTFQIDSRLAPGAELTVTVRAHTTALFAGEITAMEYLYGPSNQRDVRVRAYDKLHRLRKRQTVRSFTTTTLAAIARELCADCDMSVDADADSPEYQWLIQGRETDWQFLLRIAERNGLYLVARDAGRVLQLVTLEGAGEPVPLSLGSTLLEAQVEVNIDAAVSDITAEGWFPSEGESFKGSAATPRSDRAAVAPRPTAVSGKTMVDEIAQNDAHAGQLAQAELDRRAAADVTLWGVAEGDPRLFPGARIDVAGIAQAIGGRYVLTEATHTIDQRKGFVTEISTRPPAPAARPIGTIATPGEVSSIADPYQQGRVRVKLPTYDNVETDWMGVVTPGAGANKGLIALPDTGDMVLVLLAHEDPAHGVVLGGLYGQVSPPDDGIVAGVRRRYTFVTPQGQRISLDDSNGAIHVENKSGSTLDLTPEYVRLHAAVDLQIEAPGKQIAISAAAIDFNKA